MSYNYDDFGRDDDERERWEHEHSFEILWKCFSCGYQYHSPRGVNSAQPCPTCGQPTEESGESYEL